MQIFFSKTSALTLSFERIPGRRQIILLSVIYLSAYTLFSVILLRLHNFSWNFPCLTYTQSFQLILIKRGMCEMSGIGCDFQK